MDLTAVKRLRCTLTLHFAVIACLTAMLVATGSQSIFLPVFIFFVSFAAYIFVDRLEWFELGRIGSYIGMMVATVFSLFSYFYSAFSVPSESGQLLAIAGLLVYPEAVLFLQAKSLRVFEQLAVFLLLEMIVAALVNDNILFGILLAPIMLLWVSALFLFARYATIVHIDPSLERPTPILFDILVQRLRQRWRGSVKKEPVVTIQASLADVQASRSVRRLLQSFPIGLGAIVFAGFFFYLMPRTSPTSLDSSVTFSARVGLPKSLAIGTVGRLLADPTPVMRISLTDYRTGAYYDVVEAPYIRARVMDTYGAANRNNWVSYGEWVFGGIHEFRRLRPLDVAQSAALENRDLVKIEFDIKRKFIGPMYSLPPAFLSKRVQYPRLSYDHLNMVVEELDQAKHPRSKSLVYELGSSGFADGQQLRVSPAAVGEFSFSENRNMSNLSRDFRQFAAIDSYRRQVLANARVDLNQPYQVADALEQHFGNGNFTYTLDLRPPIDPNLDPIEDFLLNQRRGHCQYFASALVMMLRQSEIRSRIVVGYRPSEINKIGRYFPVRQSDAHAWVEALFSKAELQGTPHEPWLTDSEYYWVRFDPTALVSGVGEVIVEQQGQAIDYAEKLWKDYVVEGQKLTTEDSLYAPVAANSENAYDQLLERLQNLRQNLEQGQFFSSAARYGFAWPLTVLIIASGALAILAWKAWSWLPKVAPRLARRLGIGPQQTAVQQAFFARCLQLLSKHGLSRGPDETPGEFTHRAGAFLASKGVQQPPVLSGGLQLLTNIYYRIRFSRNQELTATEQADIDEALNELASVRPAR